MPHILRDVLADPSPEGVARALDALCREALGSPIAASRFFDASVGSVSGLRLRDGREVVVKLHAAHVSTRHLEAVQDAQRLLAAGGFPAPEPMLEPTPLGAGVATAESLLLGGDTPDGHRPEVRRILASALARVVELCRPLTDDPGFREHRMTTPPGTLWPVPHDGRFDFQRSAAGTAWRCGASRCSWASSHTASRRTGGRPRPTANSPPSPRCTAGYVADYESARGASFAADERRMVDASIAYTMGYTARCEHSDAVLDLGRRARPARAPATVPEASARAFLVRHAAELLDVDVDLRGAPRARGGR